MRGTSKKPEGNPESLLPIALTAARRAAEAIMGIYGGKIDVQYKEDESPLTLADKRSHGIIVDILRSEAPVRYPILSEEGKDIPFPERKGWYRYWLVDPLDGTREFIRKSDEFTVNIALMEAGRPVLGVVGIPARDIYYYAVRDLGAFLQDPGGVDRRLPLNPDPLEVFTVIGSRSHASAKEREFVRDMEKAHGRVAFIAAGSALKFCRVAEGRADVYPRFGPTMEWDTAAGQVVLEQAGGSVVQAETGKPLAYNKESLLNPGFIAWRRPTIMGLSGQGPADSRLPNRFRP